MVDREAFTRRLADGYIRMALDPNPEFRAQAERSCIKLEKKDAYGWAVCPGIVKMVSDGLRAAKKEAK